MAQSEWSRMKNVLCIRPDNMGDLIMTMPAIRALKQAAPGRKITLLTSPYAEPLAQLYPEIDGRIIHNAAWVNNTIPWNTQDILSLTGLIKGKRFDAAVIFTVYSQSPLPTAFLCRLAGIRHILAYSRENPYQLITDWLPDREPLYNIKHEVTRQLDLVKYTGATAETDDLFVPLDKNAVRYAAVKLKKLGVDMAKRWLVLHPGVSEARRRYPVDLYAEASRRLVHEGWQIVLTGTQNEKELADYICSKAGSGIFSTVGMLDLKQLIGLLSQTRVLIANNTGVIHVAAALKTPVIGIYAATNPQHYPWKVKHKLLLFDVPEENRSRNIIIKYAYDKVYGNAHKSVTPADIVQAVQEITTS